MTSSIKYQLVDINDTDEVIDHFHNFFYKNEPIKNKLNLQNTNYKDHDDLIRACITEQLSYKAVDIATGKIVGTLITGIDHKKVNGNGETVYESLANTSSDPESAIILEIFDFLSVDCDMFNRYPDIDKFLNGKLLSVDSAYRHRGIGESLINAVVEHGRAHTDVSLVYIFASSIWTMKACVNLGFEIIYSLPYINYKKYDKVVVSPHEPHTSMSILIKKIR